MYIDASVLGGMQRNQAYKFAAQAVLGAAKMVLETGMHPGGATIEAVASLERNGFRSSVIEAMKICSQKSKEMTK